MEAGKEKAPVFSYVKSRGFYAGVEVVGQVFVERYEENGQMYHWPGVKAGDIVSAGKMKNEGSLDDIADGSSPARFAYRSRLRLCMRHCETPRRAKPRRRRVEGPWTLSSIQPTRAESTCNSPRARCSSSLRRRIRRTGRNSSLTRRLKGSGIRTINLSTLVSLSLRLGPMQRWRHHLDIPVGPPVRVGGYRPDRPSCTSRARSRTIRMQRTTRTYLRRSTSRGMRAEPMWPHILMTRKRHREGIRRV